MKYKIISRSYYVEFVAFCVALKKAQMLSYDTNYDQIALIVNVNEVTTPYTNNFYVL